MSIARRSGGDEALGTNTSGSILPDGDAETVRRTNATERNP
jgi:hypothetical protein